MACARWPPSNRMAPRARGRRRTDATSRHASRFESHLAQGGVLSHETCTVLYFTTDLRGGTVVDHSDRRPDRAAESADQRIPRGGSADGGGKGQLSGREPGGH